MTSPLRRKRPTTRPNSKAPTAASQAVASLIALVLAAWSANRLHGDLAWRPAPKHGAAPAPIIQRHTQRSIVTRIVRDDAVQLTAAQQPAPTVPSTVDDAGHSVVVRRLGPGDEGYDPFEEDDRAQTPVLARRQQPAQDPFDPFEADDKQTPESDADQQQPPQDDQAPDQQPSTDEASQQTPEEPAEDAADSAAEAEAEPAPANDTEQAPEDQTRDARSVEEAFDEPQVPQQQPPIDVESPDRLLDEVEQGARGEMVEPSSPTPPRPEPAPADEEMADEVPGADATEPDTGVEEDADEELQAGGPLTGELPPPTPEQIEARRQEIERDRAASEKNCERILEEVKANGITNISLDISLKGNPGEDFPFECDLGDDRYEPRSWAEITYLWKASGLCHKPLYFEQVQLERYGHSWGPVMDPIVSGAHFFGTVPLLPYKMGIESPGECIYTLGYYRPGNCAPYMIPAVPFTWRAAAYEAAAAAGVILIFP